MLAEREGVVHAQRRLAGDEDLFAGDIEALAEQLGKVPADGRGKLHAHDAQPPALPQQLFHLGAQVDLAAVRANGSSSGLMSALRVTQNTTFSSVLYISNTLSA